MLEFAVYYNGHLFYWLVVDHHSHERKASKQERRTSVLRDCSHSSLIAIKGRINLRSISKKCTVFCIWLAWYTRRKQSICKRVRSPRFPHSRALNFYRPLLEIVASFSFSSPSKRLPTSIARRRSFCCSSVDYTYIPFGTGNHLNQDIELLLVDMFVSIGDNH